MHRHKFSNKKYYGKVSSFIHKQIKFRTVDFGATDMPMLTGERKCGVSSCLTSGKWPLRADPCQF
jgi:hypothetical protein